MDSVSTSITEKCDWLYEVYRDKSRVIHGPLRTRCDFVNGVIKNSPQREDAEPCSWHDFYPGNVLRVSSFEHVSAFPVLSFLTERGEMSVHGVESILPWSRLPMYRPNANRTYVNPGCGGRELSDSSDIRCQHNSVPMDIGFRI